MRKALLLSLLPILALTTTACEKGLAYGDPNAVIVAAPRDWWPMIEDSVETVLSPPIQTVREEHTFRITFQDPTEENWTRLRRFKEIVLIGGPEDPWMAEALATLPDTTEIIPPDLLETTDVWARDQNATIILVDPEGDIPYQVNFRLPRVHRILDERFREGVEIRMFVSGRDSALADSLEAMAGFSLILPEVYRWAHEDSVYIFRNDNPDPSELIRQFTVTWRHPAPNIFPADSLLDWRREVAQEYFNFPQVVDRESIRAGRPPFPFADVYEIRGAWSNPPGSTWPAAGPFVLWGVFCPGQDRLYMVDAWLYAPGTDKWEYMLQLERILGSFRCGPRDTYPNPS